MSNMLAVFATCNGALAVALGAFGAHALKARLTENQLSIWQTAVHYHFVHVLAVLALAICLKVFEPAAAGKSAGISFVLGIFFFCGSLYGLALGGPRWLGPITPLGGLLLIIGWLSFAVYAYQAFKS